MGQGGLDLVSGGPRVHEGSGTAADPRNALQAINTAAKALGISGGGRHTLRHATRMLAAGVPLHTVSELAGHRAFVPAARE
jgi:integrase